MPVRSLCYLFLALVLTSCAGSRLGPAQQAENTDLLVEFQQVTNDSIAILIGNTLRLHTGRAHPDRFFPLIVSTRSPAAPDQPTATDLAQDAQSLREILHGQGKELNSMGIVLGHTAPLDREFLASDAEASVRKLAVDLGVTQLHAFEEKGSRIVRVRVIKLD